jgi:glyoxylase-like metal-dependent hydrolase (beta-lactamase superfamily II)
MGLSSISTLIIGANAAVLMDPIFCLTDAAEWTKTKFGKGELSAIYITHHHPVSHVLQLT